MMREMNDKYILPFAGFVLLGIYALVLFGPLLISDFPELFMGVVSLVASALAIRGVVWWANLRSDRRYDDRPRDRP